MIIAAYYIDRSMTHTPCWTTANTLKRAIAIAKEWNKDGSYVSISSYSRKLYLLDETHSIIRK